MIKSMLTGLAFLCATTIYSQSALRVKISKAESNEPLSGATISIPSIKKSATTDSAGIAVFENLQPGKYKIDISYVGFHEKSIHVSHPAAQLTVAEMEPEEEEEEEIIIQSTRTSRTISSEPTRVETIALEEIDEKNNMRPSNVSMLLHESTGIQVQQTSATSANSSIRIQGLDGRYTQLLKDGFPSFGNFASGLSVLEIPPLDLKQVEVIKGPVSTLFGGGAIAGVVNFISRTPKQKAENMITLNQSHIGQTNLGYFGSLRKNKTGYTLLALFNHQKWFDVDKDDFTELPDATDFTIHPKLFLYPSENLELVIGNSFTLGSRFGGDVQVVKGKPDNLHRYFEKNKTIRNTTTFELRKKISALKTFTLKNSLSIFNRKISIPSYQFEGTSINSFTDATWVVNREKHSLVYGANIIYDDFNEKHDVRDERQFTAGLYFQDTWDISEKLILESGIRTDYTRYNLTTVGELFVLPRFSLLIRHNEKLSSRIGAGMGYKLPTMFTEQAESMHYQFIGAVWAEAERSYGGTADLNYKTKLGSDLDFSFNQLFFYTWIDKPIVFESSPIINAFVNAGEPVQTKGFETNAKFIYKHNYKLFLGYTFTDPKAKYLLVNQFLPLVPKHKLNSALIYEKHGAIKMGLEAYYTGAQFLQNGTRTNDYWELGFMTEKIWEKFSVYINFENFTDTRQSKFKRVVNEPHSIPTFDDIWTHTEGFVVNGGIKIRF